MYVYKECTEGLDRTMKVPIGQGRPQSDLTDTHYENMPIKEKETFTTKTKKIHMKNLFVFIFLLKHRLWVLVRTASARRF